MQQEKQTPENLPSGPEREKIEPAPEREIERPEVPQKPERVIEGRPSPPKEREPITPRAPAVGVPPQDLKKIKRLSKPRQLKILVEVAFNKGVYQAINLARDLDNPYLLDEFHDALIDELRQKLIEAGKLKKL